MSKKFYEKYYDSFLGLEDVPSGYALTIEEVTYYVSENFEKFENIQKGDIVSVKKFIYANGEIGQNHLFVILDNNRYMSIEYFGMIISSNAKKEKYNIKVNKDKENNLYKNSIVKTDHIYKLNKNDILKKVLLDDYVNKEKNLLDLEYDFIEKLSKIRKEKGISPSLNTILKIKKITDSINHDKKDDPRANLLRSLKPYLSDNKKDKIDN